LNPRKIRFYEKNRVLTRIKSDFIRNSRFNPHNHVVSIVRVSTPLGHSSIDENGRFPPVSCKARRRLQFTDSGKLCNGWNSKRCLFRNNKVKKGDLIKMANVNRQGAKGDYFTFEWTNDSFRVLTPNWFV